LIFDRFYRINDTMAGSGLGLAIVRDIVKDHGGVIVVTENSCGLGTIFSVRFPPLESSPDISESTPVNTVQL
jgi:two-component system sensor histidine kinase TctE